MDGPKGVALKLQPIWHVLPQLLRGKSLYRTLFNLSLRPHRVGGTVLDLGSKSTSASYYHFLGVDAGSRIILTDLFPGDSILQLDVEKRFPLEDGSVDAILAFNLFEHVFDTVTPSREAHRVLRQGGRVLVVVPFLHQFHPDPDDYWRYTPSSLRRIWEGAGFRTVHLEALGEGVLTGWATRLPSLFLPARLPWLSGLFTSLLYLITSPLDRLIHRFRRPIKGRRLAELFALGYLAVFEKGEPPSNA